MIATLATNLINYPLSVLDLYLEPPRVEIFSEGSINGYYCQALKNEAQKMLEIKLAHILVNHR